MSNWRMLPLLFSIFTASAHAACNVQSILDHAFPHNASEFDVSFTPKEMPFVELSKEVMDHARDGKRFTYFVDTYDQVHMIEDAHIVDHPGDFLLLKKPGSEDVIVIKEAGIFKYNPTQKRYVFEPKSGWNITREENEALIERLEEKNPHRKFRREPNPELDRGRVFSCADALAIQQKGGNFVWDSIVSSNVVSIAGMVTQEFTGNHLLTDPKKRRLVYADLIANNITTSITSPIIKRVIVSGAGVAKDFATRTASDYLTNAYIKKPLYDVMTPKKPEEKESIGQKLVPYDTGFAVLRFFPKRALDRFMVNRLPQMMLKSCLGGDNMIAVVTPKMIRIADRYSWGLIYLQGRNQYLNHVNP